MPYRASRTSGRLGPPRAGKRTFRLPPTGSRERQAPQRSLAEFRKVWSERAGAVQGRAANLLRSLAPLTFA